MHKNLALAFVGTLLVGLLTSCGGGAGGGVAANSTEAYCDSLESASKSFEDFDSGDITGLEDAIATFHKLAEKAPDDIAKAWATLDGAMVGVEDALAEAGLKLSDLEAVSNGEMPEDFDITKLEALGKNLEDIGSEKVQDAADAIEKHAKSECDVDLSAS